MTQRLYYNDGTPMTAADALLYRACDKVAKIGYLFIASLVGAMIGVS